MKIFEQLDRIALGTRVRFLSETITSDAAKIYGLYGIEMNPKWFPVFYVLSQAREKTITSIAEDIGHSHVSVSKIVGEMKKARLVAEKSSAKDRRRTMVSLSAAGKAIAKKIEQQYVDVRAAVEELSRESKNDLWKALEEWENLLAKKSLLKRVVEQKRRREGVEFIPYNPKHRAAFRELNLEWIQRYFRVEKKDLEQVNDPEACLEEGGQIFFVLHEGKAVGTCALYKIAPKKYELAKMAVSPASQGLGLGDLLMEGAERWAREKKGQEIIILSNTVLKPAITLYKKHGYETVHLGPHPDYERCNIEMKKSLNPTK